MKVELEQFIPFAVREFQGKDGTLNTSIDGGEIGLGSISIRVVGQGLEAEFIPFYGKMVKVVLKGVDFINRENGKYTLRCSAVDIKEVNN